MITRVEQKPKFAWPYASPWRWIRGEPAPISAVDAEIDAIRLYDPLAIRIVGAPPRKDLTALIEREVAGLAARLAGRGRTAAVVVDPTAQSAIRPRDVSEILATIERQLGLTDCVPVTLHSDRPTVSAGDARAYIAAGVNRIVLVADAIAERSARNSGANAAFNALEVWVAAARAKGLEEIVFTIGQGDAGQSLSTFRSLVESAAALAPDRIDFKVVKTPGPRDGEESEPSLRKIAAKIAQNVLRKGGYRGVGAGRYVRSHHRFAQSGGAGLALNPYGEADDAVTGWIGVGPGALSQIGPVFAQNKSAPAAYTRELACAGAAFASAWRMTAAERLAAEAVSALYCAGAADCRAYLSALSPAAAVSVSSELARLEAADEIEWRSDKITLIEAGAAVDEIARRLCRQAATPWRALAADP
ncbi:MAG: hypothetical protein AAFW81_05360 [Pseudomonadota bacterium]